MSRHGYSRGHGSGRYGLENAAGSIIGLMIFLLIIYIIVLTKMLRLIVRVMKAHPGHKGMWTQIVFCAVCLLLALVTALDQTIAMVFLGLAGCSFITLTITARMTEIYHNTYFVESISLRERLSRPWWQEQEQLEEA